MFKQGKQSSLNRKNSSSDKTNKITSIFSSLSKSKKISGYLIVKSKSHLKQPSKLKTIKQKVKKSDKQSDKKDRKKKLQEQRPQKLQKKQQRAKKKTDFSTCLKQLKPVNLQSQRLLFFTSKFTLSPLFIYPNISDIMDEQHRQNLKFDCANDQHLELSLQVLQKSIDIGILQMMRNCPALSVGETEVVFKQYIARLDISSILGYEFAENTISNTSVVHNNVEGVSTVMIGLPIRYTHATIEGVMNHEIGTHFLRKFNDRTQKWHKQRKKYNLQNCLQTQQGLAALNQMVPFILDQTLPPLLYRPALLYFGCYLASKVSFAELFHLLQKYQPDHDLRWKECVRVKRGIADTAKPGGLYKDQIYFMGAISILRNRHKLNFVNLHCGKISMEDCLRLTEKNQINSSEKVKLPHFLNDMELYMKCLNVIAEVNEIK